MGSFMRHCLIGLALAFSATSLDAQQVRPVVIFAAASLQPALEKIAADWQRLSGRNLVITIGASGTLARQIDQGAPADLFLSADTEWMDWAERRKLIRGETRRSLLGNRLVLVEPASEKPTQLEAAFGFPLAEAIGQSRLVTANVESAPAGRYAREALQALGVWDRVKERHASTDNVRGALTLVARGEARFGIVYASDAVTEPRVRVVTAFPASSHSAILYPVAVTATAQPEALSVLNFLASPPALAVFQASGFSIVE